MKPGIMKIIFNGDTGQIDANTLIAALGHYQFIMEAANKEMGGEKTVELKVNAIEKGSFVIDVEIVESLFKSIFSGDNVAYLSGIITIVGGVYSAYKKLKGIPAKTPEDADKIKVNIKTGDGTVINQKIVNIYNQLPVREAISKTVEAAEKDPSVDGLTIESEVNKIYFPREDFPELIHKNFESADELPQDKTIEQKAYLTILSMSFESGYQWQFLYHGFKIPIRIKDGPIMKLVDNGERFGKGDCVEVTLEIIQRYNPSYRAYENIKFKIKEFHRHIPVNETPSLFESNAR